MAHLQLSMAIFVKLEDIHFLYKQLNFFGQAFAYLS